MSISPARPLAGRNAVITGSTSGIGLGIATAFAEAGANLVINGLGDAAEIEKTRASLAEKGVSVHYNGANLMTSDGVGNLIAGAMETLGSVDILVNNAGIQYVAPIEDFPIEKYDAIIALNLNAAFYATRLVMGAMKARKAGRIINIASAHGLVASPFKSAYVAAKHGIVGMTKAVALEGSELGITVNAICPGYVWTPLVEKQIDEQAKVNNLPRDRVVKEIILAAQPNKKFATVEEIGALATFLASDIGGSINGSAISIDGGWVAK
jgi:3-hydroxybutyrate dehydrogenase